MMDPPKPNTFANSEAVVPPNGTSQPSRSAPSHTEKVINADGRGPRGVPHVDVPYNEPTSVYGVKENVGNSLLLNGPSSQGPTVSTSPMPNQVPRTINLPSGATVQPDLASAASLFDVDGSQGHTNIHSQVPVPKTPRSSAIPATPAGLISYSQARSSVSTMALRPGPLQAPVMQVPSMPNGPQAPRPNVLPRYQSPSALPSQFARPPGFPGPPGVQSLNGPTGSPSPVRNQGTPSSLQPSPSGSPALTPSLDRMEGQYVSDKAAQLSASLPGLPGAPPHPGQSPKSIAPTSQTPPSNPPHTLPMPQSQLPPPTSQMQAGYLPPTPSHMWAGIPPPTSSQIQTIHQPPSASQIQAGYPPPTASQMQTGHPPPSTSQMPAGRTATSPQMQVGHPPPPPQMQASHPSSPPQMQAGYPPPPPQMQAGYPPPITSQMQAGHAPTSLKMQAGHPPPPSQMQAGHPPPSPQMQAGHPPPSPQMQAGNPPPPPPPMSQSQQPQGFQPQTQTRSKSPARPTHLAYKSQPHAQMQSGYQPLQQGYQPQVPLGYEPQQGSIGSREPDLLPRPHAPPPSAYGAFRQYPQMARGYGQDQPAAPVDQMTSGLLGMTLSQGFDKLWGRENLDLLRERKVIPPGKLEPPKAVLSNEHWAKLNCSPDLFRCTMTKIPETATLLQKSRLPLGLLIHPFRDLSNLPVIQCQTIVRCRACRTYINPFVHFVSDRRWKCNLCFRVNDLPDEFMFDPVSQTVGDPSRRPEVKNSTLEFLAPAEYMLRPPQPATYVFLFDVSHNAIQSGYLKVACDLLLENLDGIPGDARTQVAFITYDSRVHFYCLSEDLSQPQMLIVSDIDDMFIPCPDNLLVNLRGNLDLVADLLHQLPQRFEETHETRSALGAALQAAFKMLSPIGGRVTVMQSCLPNAGPGALAVREDPNLRAGKEVPTTHVNPATDFYKKLALDCSGQHIAVDLFLLSSQFADLATLAGMSRFSGGCIHYYPGFHTQLNPVMIHKFEGDFHRYLTRKIGFEAVMRIRCTRGLSIHTFHGNFFVRSTDLLTLPNVNPDEGFGVQISIDENLTGQSNVCFQVALLYTSSKGERRIRIHTLALPTAGTVPDILASADQQTVMGLVAKMAVDRTLNSSLTDARDAFVNMLVDILSTYKMTQNLGSSQGMLLAQPSIKLLPLYTLALMKHVAFRVGVSTRLDERVHGLNQMKSLPLDDLIRHIYPDLYPLHHLSDQFVTGEDDEVVMLPPRLHLSYEFVDGNGAYLLDTGDMFIMYVCKGITPQFIQDIFDLPNYDALPHEMSDLPEVDNEASEHFRSFISHLQSERFMPAAFLMIREDSKNRGLFTQCLIEDRSEAGSSYMEFLQHLKTQVK